MSRWVDYATTRTDLGRLLVAATDRGVCWIRFGERDSELVEGLADAFPFATLRRAEPGPPLANWMASLVDCVGGRPPRCEVPLDVRGSQFQERVWKELATIPRGETRSYGEMAAAVGAVRGARAVARACAHNPVPLAIPCHRVIEKSGAPGGYLAGAERKAELLRRERDGSA